MDNELRMQFSAPVLRQTQISMDFGNRSSALASVPKQRTAAQALALSGLSEARYPFLPASSRV